MAWLLGLAEQYEQTAQDIRRLHARLAVQSPLAASMALAPTGGNGQTGISEAIRSYIAHNGPRTASQLTKELDWSTIRTKSSNRPSLVTSTLASMRESGSLRNAGNGLWDIDRGSAS